MGVRFASERIPAHSTGALRVRLPAERVGRLHLVKAAILAAVIAVIWIIREVAFAELPVVQGSAALAPAVLIGFFIALRRGGVPGWFVAAGLAVDLLVITFCIHIVGGIEMVSGPAAYLVVIGLAGVLFSDRAAIVAAVSAALAYASLIGAEFGGLLIHYTPHVRAPAMQLLAVVMVVLGVGVGAAMVVRAVGRLRGFLSEASRQSGRAVHALSKRLKVPLADIVRHARALEESGAPWPATLLRVRHDVARAVELVSNVLDAATIEKRLAASRPEPVKLSIVLETARSMYAATATLRAVRVVVRVEPEGLSIVAERVWLTRAVANLLSLTLRAAQGGETIELIAGSRSGGAVVTVGARGQAGAGPSRFVRPRRRLRVHEAEGLTELGLDLAAHVAAAHGGVLSVVDAGALPAYSLILSGWLPAERHVRRPRQQHRLVLSSEADVRALHRLMAVAFVLMWLSGWVFQRWVWPPFPVGAATWLLPLALLPALAVAYWPWAVPEGLVAVSIATDLLAVTTGIHLGGGVEVVAGPLYLEIIVGLAALLLVPAGVFLTAAVAAGGYATVVGLEAAGVLLHHFPYLRDLGRQVTSVVLVAVGLCASAWLVSAATRQMRQAYRRAESLRLEAVRELSHDLKNRLNTVNLLAVTLDDTENEERMDFVRRLRHSAQQALRLVHNVLDVAAVEAGPLRPRLAPTRLDDVVRQVCADQTLHAAQRDIHIETELPETPVLVLADGELLGRALENLMANAIKYGRADARVRVRLSSEAGRVRLSVSDDGPGISPAEQSRLFEKFARVEQSSGVEGSGLGLYIVRAVARAHAGKVTVDSVLGRGATFTLDLPLSVASEKPGVGAAGD